MEPEIYNTENNKQDGGTDEAFLNYRVVQLQVKEQGEAGGFNNGKEAYEYTIQVL